MGLSANERDFNFIVFLVFISPLFYSVLSGTLTPGVEEEGVQHSVQPAAHQCFVSCQAWDERFHTGASGGRFYPDNFRS